MQKRYVLIALLLCVSVFFCTDLTAQFSFQADVASRYIWRGFDLNPYKKPVLEPSLGYDFGSTGLSLNLWMSFSFVDKELNETDLTFAYTRKLSDTFSLETGLIHYGWYWAPDFRFEDDTSHEVYASVGVPDTLFEPRLTLFYDFTNGDGIYVLLETGYSVPLGRSLGAEITASLGYNGGQWLAEGTDPGFSDLNIGIALVYEREKFSVIPFAKYTLVLLDAIGQENHFWFGLSLIYELGN